MPRMWQLSSYEVTVIHCVPAPVPVPTIHHSPHTGGWRRYCTVSAASVNLPGSVQHHVCGGGRIRLPGIATRIVLQLNKSSPESPECHIATRVNHQLMRPSPERFAATFTKIKMGDSRPTWHDWSAERCVKCTVAVTAGRQARLPKKSCEVRGTA